MSEEQSLYRREYENWENLPLFFKPWYLDSILHTSWDVAISRNNGGEVIGVLPYFRSKKYRIEHITMPLLVPYLGPWLIYPENLSKSVSKVSFEKKVLNDLFSQIPDYALIKMHCHPEIQNILPAHFSGFDTLVRYTYVIHEKNKNNLWEALHTKQRNIIKSSKGKFKIIESDDIDQFYLLNSKSFSRSGNNVPYSREYLKSIYKQLIKHKSGRLLFAFDNNNEVHAGLLLANDAISTYCLAIGNDPSFKNSGALSYLMWEAINQSLKTTQKFNFEGGMIPNIEKFFRSYGGELTPYYRIQKARNILLKGVFTFLQKM